MSFETDYEFEEVAIELDGAKVADFYGKALIDWSEPDFPFIKSITLYSKVAHTPDCVIHRQSDGLKGALFHALEDALQDEVCSYVFRHAEALPVRSAWR